MEVTDLFKFLPVQHKYRDCICLGWLLLYTHWDPEYSSPIWRWALPLISYYGFVLWVTLMSLLNISEASVILINIKDWLRNNLHKVQRSYALAALVVLRHLQWGDTLLVKHPDESRSFVLCHLRLWSKKICINFWHWVTLGGWPWPRVHRAQKRGLPSFGFLGTRPWRGGWSARKDEGFEGNLPKWES